MKGIRGLLEKDFRLFRYQGGKFFLVIAIVGLFLSLAGNMGTNFCLYLYYKCNGNLFWKYN